MKTGDQHIAGVFPHLVNSAAFVDRIEIAVWGRRRARALDHIAQGKNRAIGGSGKAYARCIPGRNIPTGNQMQFKYGVMLPYRNVSPFVVILWAGRLPVTCADAMLVMDAFLRQGCRARVSRLELTFDTKGILLDRFTSELCTRARIVGEIEGEYSTTLYAGGVHSPWQLKIYRKTHDVVRVEFTLRSAFLRKHGIVKPEEISLLRKIRLWDQISFREVDQSRGDELPPRIKNPWGWLRHGLPPDLPPSMVLETLREARVPKPERWVVRSDRERLLCKMQKSLIW
jgi:hypothetical protein